MKMSLHEDVLQALLKNAFLEAAEQDIKELEYANECMYADSYQAEERTYWAERCKKTENDKNTFAQTCRQIHSSFGVCKRLATVILVSGLMLSVFLLMIPEVRADFRNFVVTFYEKYFSITASDTPIEDTMNGYTMDTPEFTLNYVPEGYMVIDFRESSIGYVYRFSDQLNQPDAKPVFSVSIYMLGVIEASYDNENTTLEDIQIREQDGYYIHFDMDDSYAVVWSDDKWLYSVDGHLSREEMMRIAENITVNEE